MKEIWVIVRDTTVCQGHGDYLNEPVLAYVGWDVKSTHPAFKTKELTQEYINYHQILGRPHMLIVNGE